MSVVLYDKNGNRSYCKPEMFQYEIDSGKWFLEDPTKQKPKPHKVEGVTEKGPVAEEITEEEYRALAKDLGIGNYHNMKLENLLPKIEEAQNANQKEE